MKRPEGNAIAHIFPKAFHLTRRKLSKARFFFFLIRKKININRLKPSCKLCDLINVMLFLLITFIKNTIYLASYVQLSLLNSNFTEKF